ENQILNTLSLSPRYTVNEMWTTDKEFVYYFSDADIDGNSPTNILYKSGGKYMFDINELANSPDTATIIKNFLAIISFIKKNTEVTLPKITVVQTGSAFQLAFEYSGATTKYLSITKEQAENLKGKELSKTNAQTTYEL